MPSILASILIVCLPLTPAAGQGAAPALEVVAEDGLIRRLTATELGSLPQVTVPSTARDSTPITLRGPTIRTLLDLVGAPAGRDLRGPRLMLAVVAEAADGYQVAFTLAELDPEFGGGEAMVALTQDGAPLPAEVGPLRLVVPRDAHFSRWVRQLVRLRVVRVAP